MRLATKVSLLLYGFSLLIILTLGWVLSLRLWDERLLLIQENVEHQIEDIDFSVEAFFLDVERDLDALAQNELVRTPDDAEFTSFLAADEKTFRYRYGEREKKIIALFNSYRLTHPFVNSVYMGRENGSFVRSHPRQSPTLYDPRDRPWYILGKGDPQKARRTDPYPSISTADINIAVVKALVDGNGRVFGVVGMDVTLTNLTQFIRRFHIRPQGKIYLLDREGVILASQEAGMQGRRAEEISPALPGLLAGRDHQVTSLEVGGKKSYLFHASSSQGGRQIAVIIPGREIDSLVRGPVLLAMLGFLAGLALLGLLTLGGLDLFILRPIRLLTRETERITRTGSIEGRVQVRYHDEVGKLAESFNRMLDTLDHSQRALREKEKDLTAYRDHLEELVKQRTAELQKTLGELALAKDRAESADRIKSAFLATMSHELRTPLNSIIGFTGILLQGMVGPLNGEQAKQLGMVKQSASHLLSLISDVLDISKIEAGQMKVDLAPADLGCLVAKVAQAVGPLAEKKGITLTVEAPATLGEVVTDARRTEQVLLNLLGNAVKFTERGSVTLSCAAGGGWVTFLVRDTGPGIPPGQMGLIFEPFHQIDTGLARKYEGTGLGLSICKRLVDLMGGEIWVESETGKGSAFGFRLPERRSLA